MALVQVKRPVKKRMPLVKKVKKGGGGLGRNIGAAVGGALGAVASVFSPGTIVQNIGGGIAGGATLGQMIGESIDPSSSKLVDPNIQGPEVKTLGLSESRQNKVPDQEPLDPKLANAKVSPQGIQLYEALQSLEEFDDPNLVNELGRPLMVGFFQDLQSQNPGVFDQGDKQPVQQGVGIGGLQRQQQPGLGQLAQRPQRPGLGGLV